MICTKLPIPTWILSLASPTSLRPSAPPRKSGAHNAPASSAPQDLGTSGRGGHDDLRDIPVTNKKQIALENHHS